MAATPAISALERGDATFSIHPYSMDLSDDLSYGEAVAEQLGVDPNSLFKTLIAIIDEQPVVAVIPVSTTLSLKKLATAGKGKKAEMADPADAERWTGYQTGGISPFGQKRTLPTFVDETAEIFETVLTSGGKRGIQIEFAPSIFAELLGAIFGDLTP